MSVFVCEERMRGWGRVTGGMRVRITMRGWGRVTGGMRVRITNNQGWKKTITIILIWSNNGLSLSQSQPKTTSK